MDRDTKHAEKSYLRRGGSVTWEQFKPFSPPGSDTLRESVRLMHDFAVAVNALGAAPAHRILDLGTGSCWTSDWLHRLNLRAVSVDISFDMLKVGQARFDPGAAALVTADIEALPFRAGSFDRALCLNALHHVPNPAVALREIARVLTDDGRIVFIEPGRGHAMNAASQSAMSDFGVLEQDLEATMLMQLCADAGFKSVTIRPLSYMTGEIELTLEELTQWRRWTATKRPLRAIRKMWRALLEIPGLRKNGLLLEDALSMTWSRILMRHVEEQSVIVASRSGHVSASREYRAAITIEPSSPLQRRGGQIVCRLRVRNIGNVTWSAKAAKGSVQVGGQLLDDAKRLTARDYCRCALPHDVGPGAECIVGVQMAAPADPGRHLKFDMVAEGVTWFEQEGSQVLVVDVPAD